MKNKRILIACCVCVVLSLLVCGIFWNKIFPSNQTESTIDQKLGDLLNASDWFALAEEYPKVKDKVQSIAIKGLSEVVLGRHFNKPEETIKLIDSLLMHHQNDLGFDNSCNLVAIKCELLGQMGLYAQSVGEMNAFLNQIEALGKKGEFPSHQSIADFYEKRREVAVPEIIRSGRDTEVSMTIEKAGRGVLMFVPVQIGGKEYRFIFDTGAGSTFVSQRFADEIGVRIISDSTMINNSMEGGAYGKSGIIDSMNIGDITFKNPILTISPLNPAVDSVYQVDAVLGADFMRLVGEVNIYPHQGKIVFPVKQTPLPSTGKNMLLLNGGMRLRLYSGKERLNFVFDTGNVRGDLFNAYYAKHKERIEKEGVKDTILVGGFGFVDNREILRLKSVPMRIGDTSFYMESISVEFDGNDQGIDKTGEDGALGMDFIQLFGKIVINFKDMFVDVDN